MTLDAATTGWPSRRIVAVFQPHLYSRTAYLADDFARAFADVDFLIGPTTPTPAFGIGQKMDDPIQMYLNDIYTIGANLAGLPALSVPCGFSGGLPVGLQLIGAHLSEPALLKVAHYFQLETDWHTRVPAAYA